MLTFYNYNCCSLLSQAVMWQDKICHTETSRALSYLVKRPTEGKMASAAIQLHEGKEKLNPLDLGQNPKQHGPTMTWHFLIQSWNPGVLLLTLLINCSKYCFTLITLEESISELSWTFNDNIEEGETNS
ncbi:hypothetical protein TNIN_459671 [Trichonephila inaurata madagascariensis]|uniref:Uncharacterized protein n=1 Tax=Trichonephila inaurata madagascariensis TaxID=2747483 RepID=A0A8X6Y1Y6_9ARAC|nr:hypothetical protein TNIN_459671 [Trichonephila inaurata madagascariensis]